MAKGPKRGDRTCKEYKISVTKKEGGGGLFLIIFQRFRSLTPSYINVRGTYGAFKTLNLMRLLQLSYNFSVNNSN